MEAGEKKLASMQTLCRVIIVWNACNNGMKPSNKSMHLGKKYFPNLSSKYIWGKLFSADFKKFILLFAYLMLCI